MRLKGTRPQMSGQLELPLEGRGEAPRVQRSEEVPMAARATEGSGRSDLMEMMVRRPNLQNALRRVKSDTLHSEHTFTSCPVGGTEKCQSISARSRMAFVFREPATRVIGLFVLWRSPRLTKIARLEEYSLSEIRERILAQGNQQRDEHSDSLLRHC
jgi:hypothetical protein